MPRKLKTYQTSLGFFDLAIAAPSMKAALDAWDSNANLFIKDLPRKWRIRRSATTAKPGVVLRRAVGSNGSLANMPSPKTEAARGKRVSPQVAAAPEVDDKAARAAMVAYAREQWTKPLAR